MATPRCNPYTWDFGIRPPFLAGRDSQIKDFERLLDLTGKSLLVWGLRGVGKTVLLDHMRNMLRDRKRQSTGPTRWVASSLRHETITSELDFEIQAAAIAADLIEKINKGSNLLAGITDFIKSVEQLRVGEVEFKRRIADARPTAGMRQHVIDLFSAVAKEATDFNVGVVIFLDEIQDLDKDSLDALLVAVSSARRQSERRLGLVAAGLPSALGKCSAAFPSSHTLIEPLELGRLSFENAAEALEKPEHAKRFTKDALARVIEMTDGYPYFIQAYGFWLWEETQDNTIRLVDVERIQPIVETRLLDGFYEGKWDKCGVPARRYLVAMGSIGSTPCRNADVAKILRVRPDNTKRERDELLGLGLIYEADDDLAQRGTASFEFAFPRFDWFLAERHPWPGPR